MNHARPWGGAPVQTYGNREPVTVVRVRVREPAPDPRSPRAARLVCENSHLAFNRIPEPVWKLTVYLPFLTIPAKPHHAVVGCTLNFTSKPFFNVHDPRSPIPDPLGQPDISSGAGQRSAIPAPRSAQEPSPIGSIRWHRAPRAASRAGKA